jgi:hypothetical protein
MRISTDLRLPQSYDAAALAEVLRRIVTQLNNLSDGRLNARDSGLTAPPTTGRYAVGDVVWHTSPSETTTTTGNFVVMGWVCTASGEPGTFEQMRVLTGA